MSSTTSSPPPDRYVDARDSRGVQIGDHGVQKNNFTLNIPRGVRNAAIILIISALVAGAAWIVVTWLLPQFAPTYKTQFLIDTSAGAAADGTEAIAKSLTTAVGNSGDHDALALRSFGGECGAENNTTQLVDFDTDNRQQIIDAAGGIGTGSKATLLRGIVQAVDDFSSPFTQDAKQVSRVIVVTQHGIDACDEDIAFVEREIRNRISAAGLAIEFRFVGYQIPDTQRSQLTHISTAAGAPGPTFVNTPAELDAAVNWFTNAEPVMRDAQKIIDVLNPTVDRVNTAVKAITDGHLDTAESTLNDARSTITNTDAELNNLQDRTKTPIARDIHDRAAHLRIQQGRVVTAAVDLLDAARSHSPLDAKLAAFQQVATDYNREVNGMNDALNALRATGPAAGR
jgi:hypothetical protein